MPFSLSDDYLAQMELEAAGQQRPQIRPPSVAGNVWNSLSQTAAPIAQQAASYVTPAMSPQDQQLADMELEQAGSQPSTMLPNPFSGAMFQPPTQRPWSQGIPYGPGSQAVLQAPPPMTASRADLMRVGDYNPDVQGLLAGSMTQPQGMGISPQVGALDPSPRHLFDLIGRGANTAMAPFDYAAQVGSSAVPLLAQGLTSAFGAPDLPNVYRGLERWLPQSGRFNLPDLPSFDEGMRNTSRDVTDPMGAVDRFRDRPWQEQLVAGAIFDPTNLIGVGAGADVAMAGLRNLPSPSAVGRYGREVVEAGARQSITPPNVTAFVPGQGVIGGAGPTTARSGIRTAADLPSMATTTALGGMRRSTPLPGTELVPNDPLLGVRNLPPEQDSLINRGLDAAHVRQADNAQVRPIMQERGRTSATAEMQATRLDAKGRAFESKFKWTNVNGNRLARLTDGTAEDIRDIAARLPEYEATGRVTPRQARAIRELGAEVESYRNLNEILGADIGLRHDVMDGGVYLPRGSPEKVGTKPFARVSSGRRGGKPGLEKGAVYATVREGINNGEKYPRLADAIYEGARESGTAAADRAAAKQLIGLTDEAGEPLGKTALDRLTPSGKSIRERVLGIRQSIASLKGTGQRLDARLEKAVDDILAKPVDDWEPYEIIDALDLRVGANAVGKQGPNYGRTPRQLRVELARLQDELRAIAPAWKEAREAAAKTPRDQGSIGLVALTGRTFPDDVANTANRFLNREGPLTGRGAGPLRAVQALNAITFPLRLGADIGYAFIHGLIPAAVDKASWAKAVVASTRAIFDGSTLGKVIDDIDLRHAKEGLPSTRDMVRNGLAITGSGAQNLGWTQGFVRTAPVFKQLDRAFGTFADSWRLMNASNRLQTAKALGLDVFDDAVQRDIYKGLNQITAYGSKPFAGEWGQFLTTAPRMYQADFELLGNAIKGGGISGAIARDAVIRTAGQVVGATIMANHLRGYDTEFGVEVTMEDGKPKVYFPPDWMAIKDVNGVDVKLLGRFDSLLKLLAATANGDLTYGLETKMAPGVGIIYDAIKGEDFMGREYGLGSAEGIKNMARSFLPIWAEGMTEGEPLAGTIFDILGLKAREASFRTQAGREYFKDTGRDYERDRKGEPRMVYDWFQGRPDMVEAEQKYIKEQADNGQDWAKNVIDVDEARATFGTAQAALDEDLLQGGDPEIWRSQRGENLGYTRGFTDAVWRNFDPSDDSDQDPRIRGYYDAMDMGRDITGAWDSAPLDAYMEGLTPTDREWVEDNTGLTRELSPVEQMYRHDVSIIAESGYWDVADEIARFYASDNGLPSHVDTQAELYQYVRNQVGETMRADGKDPNSLQWRSYRDEWVATNLAHYTEWLANNRAEKRNEFVTYDGQQIQLWELLVKWGYKEANEDEREWLSANGSTADNYALPGPR